jgi:hypothetical protein
MAMNPFKVLQDRRRAAARRKRIRELERDPNLKTAVREALESERRDEGVRFDDLKRTHG